MVTSFLLFSDPFCIRFLVESQKIRNLLSLTFPKEYRYAYIVYLVQISSASDLHRAASFSLSNDSQSDIVFSLFLQPIFDIIEGNFGTFFSSQRRSVDTDWHSHQRLIYFEARNLLIRVAFLNESMSDSGAWETWDQHNVSCVCFV